MREESVTPQVGHPKIKSSSLSLSRTYLPGCSAWTKPRINVTLCPCPRSRAAAWYSQATDLPPAPSLKVISVLGSSPASLLPDDKFLTDSTVISSNWTHAASRLLVSKD